MKKQNQRSSYIDMLKGVSIFLVLWRHRIQVLFIKNQYFDNFIFNIIYSFHMPLFCFRVFIQ